ncbi:MAG: DUF4177 domain-containing protein [Firmicutes bacterium]|nr:DUF4177 domain-containing protein [Bacillota bacterium]
MEKFEYKCIGILGGGRRTTRILNEYGRDGWELVSTWSIWHYFKRKLSV